MTHPIFQAALSRLSRHRRGWPLAFSAALVGICLWLCASSIPAAAQVTGQGTISGLVTDSTGAVIVNASVTITDVATNIAQTTASNNTGYYEVDNLNPGTYKIAAAAPGFEGLVRQGITLLVDTRLNVPLTLKAGAAQQTIVVSADAALLDTESGSNGQVLTTHELQTIPMSGENPIWLAMMAPGVQTTLSQDVYRNGTLNDPFVGNFGTAGTLNDNEFSLDGAPNVGSGRTPAINPSPDEIGEMKLNVSGFDASVGHSMGVSVTETTKSGTNQLHGAIREQYWDRRWAAMGRFQGLSYRHQQALDGCVDGPGTSPQCFKDENLLGWPGVHENNGDGALGGPVYIPKLFDGRNKLFFFASFLDDVFSDSGSSSRTLPTSQERTGNFNDLPVQTTNIPAAFTAACPGYFYYGQYQIYNPFSVTLSNGVPRRTPFCGNVIPANLIGASNSKMINAYQSEIPAPNNGSVTGGNFTSVSIIPQVFHQLTIRFDYAPSQADHIFARWSRATYQAHVLPFTLTGIDEYSGPRWINTGAAGWDHVFSNRTTSSFTVAATDFQASPTIYAGYDAFTPSDLGLPTYMDTYAGQYHEFPVLSISSYTGLGQADSASPYYRITAFRETLTHVQGKHTMRLGAEWRQQNFAGGGPGNRSGTFSFDDTYTQQNNGTDATFSQSNTGLAYAAFLMNVDTQASVTNVSSGSFSSPYYAFYFGDTWRITPKLTVIPGIRYEFEYGPTEKHNRQIVGWNSAATLPVATAAQSAYASALAGATAAQKAVLPSSITVQGGPIYAGVNGASARQWNSDYRILPRIAVNYQITPGTVIRGGYGLFFDTLNALNGGQDQDGYSTSTVVPTSTTYGTNFVNTPPLSNPFPNGFNAAIGNAAGAMYYSGSSPTIYNHSIVPPRSNRGEVSVQHQFGPATMLEVAWVGNLTTKTSVSQNQAPPPASLFTGGQQPNSAVNSLLATKITNPYNLANFASLATTNPAAYSILALSSYYTQSQISISNLVRPYSQLSGLTFREPIGTTHFQEVQVTLRRRMQNGLVLNGMLQINDQHDRDYFANPYDAEPSWEPSNNSAPYRFTAEGAYDLPFGKGKAWATSGWKNAIFGGFHLDATYELQEGSLLGFGNLFYVGKTSAIQLRNKGYHNNLATGGYNYIQWLNVGNVVAVPTTVNGVTTCAYSGTGFVTNPSCQPNSYNQRVFPTRVEGVRAQGPNGINTNLGRSFRITERVKFDTRFEVYNLLNHQFNGSPNTSVTNAQFGQTTSDGGQGGLARWVAIQGHLTW